LFNSGRRQKLFLKGTAQQDQFRLSKVRQNLEATQKKLDELDRNPGEEAK